MLLKVVLFAYSQGIVGSRGIERACQEHVATHHAAGARAELRDWLAAHPKDRHGSKGAIRESNRTDNESAKMATGNRVIQGYTGVAAVDKKHQIIVEAQARGTRARNRKRSCGGDGGPAATRAGHVHHGRCGDAPAGRARYAQRFAAVEPVFANLRYNKGLDRFTLRGPTKLDAQWKLFCLVHNIEKLANNGYAA